MRFPIQFPQLAVINFTGEAFVITGHYRANRHNTLTGEKPFFNNIHPFYRRETFCTGEKPFVHFCTGEKPCTGY